MRGLLLENAALAVISLGSLDELELPGSSELRACDVSASSTVGAGSTLIQLVGAMPAIDLPEFAVLQDAFTITVDGEPGFPLVLLLGAGLQWIDVPSGKLELISFTELPALLSLPLGIIPGSGSLSFISKLPANGDPPGLPLVMQPVTRNPVTGAYRFGTVAAVVGLP